MRQPREPQPSVTAIASAIGEPAREKMLNALMDGRALTATELALEADVTPSTASSHLAKLERAGLIARATQGRHRYFLIASSAVAQLLESLTVVATAGSGVRTGPRDPAMRRRGSATTTSPASAASRCSSACGPPLVRGDDGALELTADGDSWLAALGIDATALRALPARSCAAASTGARRRDHLAGAVGAALLARMFELRLASRATIGRALSFSPRGETFLDQPRSADAAKSKASIKRFSHQSDPGSAPTQIAATGHTLCREGSDHHDDGTQNRGEAQASPPVHSVGDGFRVRGYFSAIPNAHRKLSPFLLLDYRPARIFADRATRRGVGSHPHRGFETVTIAFEGSVAHHDSTGHGGVIGPGDVQWMTAALGHPPQGVPRGGVRTPRRPMQMVQLWVNLPKAHKMARRAISRSRDQMAKRQPPRRPASVRVIAGEYRGRARAGQDVHADQRAGRAPQPRRPAELAFPAPRTRRCS